MVNPKKAPAPHTTSRDADPLADDAHSPGTDDSAALLQQLLRVRDAMRQKVLHRLSVDIPGGEPMHRLVLERFDAALSDAALAAAITEANSPEGVGVAWRFSALLFDELLIAWRMLGHSVEKGVTALTRLEASADRDSATDDTNPTASPLH